MKVLLCGMNGNQNQRKFYLRQQLKVVPSAYSLLNCLVDMGHEVEQRAVQLGEDLSEYDEVFVYLAGPRQLVTTKLYEGLWAISERPDCVVLVDDWQAPDLFKGVEKCSSEQELFAPFILGVNKKTVEELQPYKDELLQAVQTVREKKNRMLISAFDTKHLNDPENYGPHLLFNKVTYPRDRIFTYSPNPYHRNRTWGDPYHEGPEDPTWTPVPGSLLTSVLPKKERRFNFASLVQSRTKKWLKQQGYVKTGDEEGMIGTWPVDLYGSKKDAQKRLTEDQMVQTFARDWGCLMPGYDHAGSGWWRAKPEQLADAGSILIGDDKELRVLYGSEYPYFGLKASDLITAEDEDLQLIAATQRQCLLKLHPLDKEVQKRELQAVLEAVR
jgi:hypothetical protein